METADTPAEEEPAVVEETAIEEEIAPAEELAPAEEPAPIEEAAPVEEATPVEEAVPVEEATPVEEDEEDGPLEEWTRKELADECKKLGLSDKGTKAVLIGRIQEAREAAVSTSAEEPMDVTETATEAVEGEAAVVEAAVEEAAVEEAAVVEA